MATSERSYFVVAERDILNAGEGDPFLSKLKSPSFRSLLSGKALNETIPFEGISLQEEVLPSD